MEWWKLAELKDSNLRIYNQLRRQRPPKNRRRIQT